MDSKVKEVADSQKSRIEELKSEINQIINKLYNEITASALNLDKYRIPINGIPFP